MKSRALDRLRHITRSLDMRAALWAFERVSTSWRWRTERLRRCFDENWYNTQYRLTKSGPPGATPPAGPSEPKRRSGRIARGF